MKSRMALHTALRYWIVGAAKRLPARRPPGKGRTAGDKPCPYNFG